MTEPQYPEDFTDFLAFLCKKYGVDEKQVSVDYSSNRPPPLRGSRHGYYDGLLSYREKDGHPEFLITVFKIAREPMLTLGHEFAHLVEDLKSGNIDKPFGPPDNAVEMKKLDDRALRDLREFQAQKQFFEK